MFVGQAGVELEFRRRGKKRDHAGSGNWHSLVDSRLLQPMALADLHRLVDASSVSANARAVVADLRDRPQKICNHILCETSVLTNLMIGLKTSI